MTPYALASILPHRGPALFLERIVEFDGASLTAESIERGGWMWPEALEAAAQGAGLLVGLQVSDMSVRRRIAAFEQMVLHHARTEGRLRVAVRGAPPLLDFLRCDVAVESAQHGKVLEARVVIAWAK